MSTVASDQRFEAVAIGASAGGVEAITALLRALPRAFGASVLITLHVPPRRSGSLVDLLTRSCTLPVHEALDKQPVSPGHVIVAPAGYHLLVEPTRTVALSVDPPVLHSRPAIDPMFESAAVAYREQLLAILLTGASSDGTAGLAAVRRCGGTAWVQDPATAYAATMPASALAGAGADAVLDIDAMRLRLSQLGVR